MGDGDAGFVLTRRTSRAGGRRSVLDKCGARKVEGGAQNLCQFVKFVSKGFCCGYLVRVSFRLCKASARQVPRLLRAGLESRYLVSRFNSC